MSYNRSILINSKNAHFSPLPPTKFNGLSTHLSIGLIKSLLVRNFARQKFRFFYNLFLVEAFFSKKSCYDHHINTKIGNEERMNQKENEEKISRSFVRNYPYM